MKKQLQKTKKFLVGISCFLFAFLLFSQNAAAAEAEPPIAEVTNDALKVTDEQGITYRFIKLEEDGVYATSVNLDFENVIVPEKKR